VGRINDQEGEGWRGSSGLFDFPHLLLFELLQQIHIQVSNGFDPVFVNLGGQRAD
jgi:hypothetical protein